jgi:hypothetical protein
MDPEWFADATALRRGASRFLLKLKRQSLKGIKRETPRRKAMASQRVLRLVCSREREPPRRKAMASKIRPQTNKKNRSTFKGWNGHRMAVSPFDGANRIRFKGSHCGDSQPPMRLPRNAMLFSS